MVCQLSNRLQHQPRPPLGRDPRRLACKLSSPSVTAPHKYLVGFCSGAALRACLQCTGGGRHPRPSRIANQLDQLVVASPQVSGSIHVSRIDEDTGQMILNEALRRASAWTCMSIGIEGRRPSGIMVCLCYLCCCTNYAATRRMQRKDVNAQSRLLAALSSSPNHISPGCHSAGWP